MTAKKKTAKKKVAVPKVVLPKGAKKKGAIQGSQWSAEVVHEKKMTMSRCVERGDTIARACEVANIGKSTHHQWCKDDKEYGDLMQDIKGKARKEREKIDRMAEKTIDEYMAEEQEHCGVLVDGEGRSYALRPTQTWLYLKEKTRKAEMNERNKVQWAFQERQLQIQELQNKVDEEREKRLLIEAQERKVWKEMESERRSNLLWAARQTIEQKIKMGVPPEEIAVSCEVRGAQISAIAKKYAAHLADEKQQGDFVFGKHGATQDEIENVDIWYEMAAKIRSKPGEFTKRA